MASRRVSIDDREVPVFKSVEKNGSDSTSEDDSTQYINGTESPQITEEEDQSKSNEEWTPVDFPFVPATSARKSRISGFFKRNSKSKLDVRPDSTDGSNDARGKSPTLKKRVTSVVSKGKFKRSYTDDFEPSNVIGTGKFSLVYKTAFKSTNEVRAVKVINKKGLTKHQLNQIKNEVHICRAVSGKSDNIVTLHDYYAEARHNYFIFEYISGGELFDEIVAREAGLSEAEATVWFRQLLSALDVRFPLFVI